MSAVSGTTGAIAFTSGYTSNCFKWEADFSVESLEITPLTSAARTRMAGIEDAKGSYECYIDGTTASPKAGTTGSAVFTAHTGKTYTGAILVTNVKTGISADGSNRTLTINWEGNGVFTAA